MTIFQHDDNKNLILIGGNKVKEIVSLFVSLNNKILKV